MAELNPEIVGGPEPTEELSQSSLPSHDAADSPQPVSETVATEWKWGEGILGNGPRPDFLAEKFESVESQAKAYTELEKRLGSFKGAPKDGYKFENLPDGITADDPLVKGFADTFKELNLSQEGFEKVVARFLELGNDIQEPSLSNEDLQASLGPDGKAIMERVDNWMGNFSPDDQATIRRWANSPEDIKALDAIRAGRSQSRAPTTHEVESRHMYETSKAVEAERAKNWKDYTTNAAYRSEIERRWTDALLREGKG